MIVVLLACGPSSDTSEETGRDTASDTGAETAVERDTHSDSDTSSDTDGESGDTGGEVGDDGLLAWEGEAELGEGWQGTEAVVFIENVGLGETLCRIEYTVTELAPRDDCAQCLLAYDVLLGAPTIVIDERCAQAGYDAAAVASIEGETRGYGLALDFLGHSNVLMIDIEGRWTAGAFVDWREAEERVSYLWEQAVIAY